MMGKIYLRIDIELVRNEQLRAEIKRLEESVSMPRQRRPRNCKRSSKLLSGSAMSFIGNPQLATPDRRDVFPKPQSGVQ